jgi:hypothetical protein
MNAFATGLLLTTEVLLLVPSSPAAVLGVNAAEVQLDALEATISTAWAARWYRFPANAAKSGP